MLCGDFLKPVLISFCVAFPISYMLVQKFLEGYAFRIPISAMLFLTVGSMMMGFVLVTISFQSINAALKRPVDVLKSAE